MISNKLENSMSETSEVKCFREEDVCVLMPVACITSSCPSVPQCKRNPCADDSEAIRDRNGIVFSCVQDEDCGRDCVLLSAAISKLRNFDARVSLNMPQCNEYTGMFEVVQCDEFNSCWCVNSSTGVAVHGSRMKLLDSSLAFAFNICAAAPLSQHSMKKHTHNYRVLKIALNFALLDFTAPDTTHPCEEFAVQDQRYTEVHSGSLNVGNPHQLREQFLLDQNSIAVGLPQSLFAAY
ncbi:unnamed protein product [Gongylonema pulchrum]|uniref:Thyroglobulin type-1 domain-containing protein n=1 Tax=Gongylonema pulchrum TaxID=637853 RepID=A0A183E2V2_9BILA|nr:unnamed protein product [Gongylonema pulchrum]